MRGDRRIVVTGLGCVSPVGNDIETAWDNVVNGRSGIGPLTEVDPEKFSCKIAGEIRDFDVTDYLAPKDARKSDPFIHYGIAAAVQAITDAGLPESPDDPTRYGLAIGSGIGGIKTIEDTYKTFLDSGPRRISPFFVPGCIINMIAGQVSIRYGYKGPNISIVTACTTGTHNIGDAARMIAYGDADVMIAGGSEFGTTPTAMGGFCAARALSTRNDDPAHASRPLRHQVTGPPDLLLGDPAHVEAQRLQLRTGAGVGTPRRDRPRSTSPWIPGATSAGAPVCPGSSRAAWTAARIRPSRFSGTGMASSRTRRTTFSAARQSAHPARCASTSRRSGPASRSPTYAVSSSSKRPQSVLMPAIPSVS